MDEVIRNQLFELADEKYQKFSSSLLPNVKNIIGVRLPKLRKIAKIIAKGDWREFLKSDDSEYFEEGMLKGMVIGYASADVEEILQYAADFIPKIDNWSVCDSFCSSLKIAKNNQERVFEFIKFFIYSEKEYEIRFGIVMLLNYYINEKYLDEVLNLLDYIKHEGYYVKMAVAWAVSMCYVKYTDKTMQYLNNNTLDDFTYNKALQKITESLKVDKDEKQLIRSMKRSEKRVKE